MNRTRMFRAVLLGLLGLSTLPASATEPGTSGGDLLKMGIGVRPVALGGAYSAVGDDVHVMGYNPAGLARVSKYSFALDHFQGFADVLVESLGAAIPTKGYGNFGIQFLFRHIPEIDNELASDPPVTAYDLLLTVSNAHQFGKLSVGASFKTIFSSLAEKQAVAQAVDAGVKVQALGCDFAASMLNLGPGIQFQPGDHIDPLPLTFRAGVSRPLLVSPASTLLAALEAAHVRDEGFQGSMGIEYWHRSLLAVRAGYRVGEGESLGNGFSAGAALRHNFGRLEYEIGYAWRPSSVTGSFLAQSHLFGLLLWY